MIRDVALELGIKRFDTRDVDKEIGQFVHAGGEALIAAGKLRIIAKKVGVPLADHAAARAGRDDHVVELFELLERFLCQVACQRAITRVVGRLAAARLGGRHYHVVTGLFQQLEHRKTDVGPHQINQASDEQSYAHGESLVFLEAAIMRPTPSQRGFSGNELLHADGECASRCPLKHNASATENALENIRNHVSGWCAFSHRGIKFCIASAPIPAPMAEADKDPGKTSIQVIERMMMLLDALAEHADPVSLKALSASTGLHPSTGQGPPVGT